MGGTVDDEGALKFAEDRTIVVDTWTDDEAIVLEFLVITEVPKEDVGITEVVTTYVEDCAVVDVVAAAEVVEAAVAAGVYGRKDCTAADKFGHACPKNGPHSPRIGEELCWSCRESGQIRFRFRCHQRKHYLSAQLRTYRSEGQQITSIRLLFCLPRVDPR